MKKNKKRIIALLLIIALIINFAPINTIPTRKTAAAASVLNIGDGGKIHLTEPVTITSTSWTGNSTNRTTGYLDDYEIYSDGNANQNKIIVQSGKHNILLRDVNINLSSSGSDAIPLEIQGTADVTLYLQGTVTLAGSANIAGITVGNNAKLTIVDYSSGILNASSTNGAAVGGYSGVPGGVITIDSGIINVTSTYGAGIGGGSGSTGNDIVINNGTINATSTYGADIGAGYNADMAGNITINGGTVTCKSPIEGSHIGLIGAGHAALTPGANGHNCTGKIFINGGTVTANNIGGSNGTTNTNAGGTGGIGGSSSSIEMTGGIVISTNFGGAAGGGGGYGCGGAGATERSKLNGSNGANGGCSGAGGHSNILIAGGCLSSSYIGTGNGGCGGSGGGGGGGTTDGFYSQSTWTQSTLGISGINGSNYGNNVGGAGGAGAYDSFYNSSSSYGQLHAGKGGNGGNGSTLAFGCTISGITGTVGITGYRYYCDQTYYDQGNGGFGGTGGSSTGGTGGSVTINGGKITCTGLGGIDTALTINAGIINGSDTYGTACYPSISGKYLLKISLPENHPNESYHMTSPYVMDGYTDADGKISLWVPAGSCSPILYLNNMRFGMDGSTTVNAIDANYITLGYYGAVDLSRSYLSMDASGYTTNDGSVSSFNQLYYVTGTTSKNYVAVTAGTHEASFTDTVVSSKNGLILSGNSNLKASLKGKCRFTGGNGSNTYSVYAGQGTILTLTSAEDYYISSINAAASVKDSSGNDLWLTKFKTPFTDKTVSLTLNGITGSYTSDNNGIVSIFCKAGTYPDFSLTYNSLTFNGDIAIGTSHKNSIDMGSLTLTHDLTKGSIKVSGNTNMLKESSYNITVNGETFQYTGDGKLIIDGKGTCTSNNITLDGTPHVYVKNLEVSCVGGTSPVDIITGSDAWMTISGSNTLVNNDSAPAIHVPTGAKLKIDGDGTLNATGGSGAAGIGGLPGESAGSIILDNITGTVTGGAGAEDIGNGAGASDASDASVTINGGNVDAGIVNSNSYDIYGRRLHLITIQTDLISRDIIVAWDGNDGTAVRTDSSGKFKIYLPEGIDKIYIYATDKKYEYDYSEESGLTGGTLVGPSITRLSGDCLIPNGEQLSLSVGAKSSISSNTLTYQWYQDDSKIDGATGANYSVYPSSPADTGVYKVRITESNGVYTDSEDITVQIGQAEQEITGTINYNKVIADSSFILDNTAQTDITYTLISATDNCIDLASDGTVTINQDGTAQISAVASSTPAYKSTQRTLTITISKNPFPDYTVTGSEVIYDQQPHGLSVTLAGNPSYKMEYKTEGTEDSEYTEEEPVNAGDYTVRISLTDDKFVEESVTESIKIKKRELVLENIKAVSKEYDGTDIAEITCSAISGCLEGDSINGTIIPSGTYSQKDVGNNLSISLPLTEPVLLGDDSENYYLPVISEQLYGDILSKTLTASAVNMTKYVGEPNQELAYTISGFVNGETSDTLDGFIAPDLETDVQTISSSGAFEIRISGGNPTQNYNFSYVNGFYQVLKHTVSNIEMSGLTVTYDGLPHQPNIQISHRENIHTPETLIRYKAKGEDDAAYTTTIPSKAGIYTVNVSTVDNDYENEEFTDTLKIKKAVLNPGHLTVLDKYYDGTNTAIISGSGITGVIDGNDITASYGTGNYESKNAGNNIPVSYAGLTILGTDACNYLAEPITLQGNISKAAVNVGNLSATKTYDGTTDAIISGYNIRGLISGDAIEVHHNKAFFATAQPGINIPVSFVSNAAITLTGDDKDNYEILPVSLYGIIYNQEKNDTVLASNSSSSSGSNYGNSNFDVPIIEPATKEAIDTTANHTSTTQTAATQTEPTPLVSTETTPEITLSNLLNTDDSEITMDEKDSCHILSWVSKTSKVSAKKNIKIKTSSGWGEVVNLLSEGYSVKKTNDGSILMLKNVTLTLKDKSGNKYKIQVDKMIVDNTAPAIKLKAKSTISISSSKKANYKKNIFKKAVKLYVSDTYGITGKSDLSYAVKKNSSDKGQLIWKTVRNGVISVKHEGKSRIFIRAYDNIGNKTIVKTEGFIIDYTAPVISVTGEETGGTVAYDSPPTVSVKDNLTKTKVVLDDKKISSHNFKVKYGNHTITAIDRSGNKSIISVSVKRSDIEQRIYDLKLRIKKLRNRL